MGKSKNSKPTQPPINKTKNSSSLEPESENIQSYEEKQMEFLFSKLDLLIAGFCFISTLAVYVRTIHPSLPGGDSGELIIAAHEFGVAHPPGYPLFTLLARLSMVGSPPGHIAWRVNLLSAVCGALCSAGLYLTTYRLSASHMGAPQDGAVVRGASLLAALMFPFSRLAWVWSLCAEVFALNNLLLTLLLYTAVTFDLSPAHCLTGTCYTGAFLCGVCLSNQHTSVLYIVVLVPWVMWRLWRAQLLCVRVCVGVCVWFIVGLLPYVYLPVSSTRHTARWTWGDQSTVGGVLTHVLRREYGTLDLLKDHTGQGFISGLWAYMNHAWRDLSPVICLLFAASVVQTVYRVCRGRHSVLGPLHLMLGLYLGFFCWRANLDIHNPLFFRVVERFWIQSDLVVCILGAVSFGELIRMLHEYTKRSVQAMGVPLAVMLIGFQLQQTWHDCDQSGNHVVQDFAVQTLRGFPPGSLILTEGDLPGNSFRYFHLCEGERADLTVFDQEILTYEWSVPMLGGVHSDLVIPGQRWMPRSGVMAGGGLAFTFRELIDANYGSREIFACIGVQKHESSWTQGYVLFPYGVCQQIVDKRTPLSVSDWDRRTEGLTRSWNYTLHGKSDGSWESVANEEMWRARTATGLFFLEQALATSNKQVQTELLLAAYKVYSREMSRHSAPHIPAYWHRNFAIVCDHLSHSPHLAQLTTHPAQHSTHLSHIGLVRSTAEQFQMYIDKETHFDSQEDVHKIKVAIETLQAYLDNYNNKDTDS